MTKKDDSAKRAANNTPHDALLCEREAAAFLKMSIQWMQISRHRGEGPPFLKIGRSVRYDLADLKAWLKTRRHQNTSEFSRAQG